MATKRVGSVIVVIGLVGVALSFLVDILGFGDDGIQAAQLLGIEMGVILILAGFVIMQSEHKLSILRGVRTTLVKIVNLPSITWVLFSFLIVYVFFFISPMFLNSKLQMFYFNRYLPSTGLIGLDIRVLMNYIKDWLVFGQSPYLDGSIIYPPLALILFAPLLIIGFPAFFKLITFLTLASYIFTSLLIPLAYTRGKNKSILIFLFSMGIFSYGLQFELERGQSNLIAYALCLLSFYIFYTFPKFRYIAYFLFSLSVHLKVYPAIFILMFVDDWRDWKTYLRRLFGIVLFNIILLFILGFGLFQSYASAIIHRQFASTPWQGSSISSFVYVLSNTGFGIFSENLIIAAKQTPILFKLFFLTLFFLCLITIIIFDYARQLRGFNPYLFVACTVGAFIIPSESHDYKLPLLVAPVSLLLSNLPSFKKLGKKVTSIVLINIISLAFWSTLYPFEIKPEILQNNMPVLMIILISAVILYLMKTEKRNQAWFHGSFSVIDSN